jgi:hypothetical protein
MPGVLTTSATVSCAQGGKVSPLTSSATLKVGGNAVLLENQVSTWTVSGCGNTNAPCASVSMLPGKPGVATKLKVKGSAVLLANFAATGTADPISASNAETKLTAS